ncbi:MlaD family protein [Mycobacterium sp. 94-17]|uniref:MlaD family protein n=1 Tax=Mycobacterium sp. 94-17 TaxID=2986147 RepID=UPI002D1E84F2|nr:MlaD family protein [Mycobacterium sp. 94-17]MEB4209567.1 MlaD family protein [Mycobacterium sp. 94-17]
MLTRWPRRLRSRLAAAVLITLLFGSAALTYAGYSGRFLDTAPVTVSAPRAGLVMDRDAKVKYLGVRVGSVQSIAYAGGEAHLELAIDRKQLRRIPGNATVRIASTTIFGAKSVELIAPADPSRAPLRPGAQLRSSGEQLEVNTLFQTLVDVLHKVPAYSTTLGEVVASAPGFQVNLYGAPPPTATAMLFDTVFQPNKLPSSLADFLRGFIQQRIVVKPRSP